MRMALTYGLHRERPIEWPQGNSPERCRNLWWTVYVLDRNFSSSMGVPTSIRDEDITTSLPTCTLPHSAALHYNARLSQILAQVMEKVYGAYGRLHRQFLPSIQAVLKDTAGLGRELEDSFPLSLGMSTGGISRAAATLHISYHHTIILATYPLLFCVFEKHLHDISKSIEPRPEPSERTRALIQASLESASQIIRIVSVLRHEHLLESFLSFDLEHTFSAAFILIMMAMTLPGMSEVPNLINKTYRILDDMVAQGNVIATFRRTELEVLSSFARKATSIVEALPAGRTRSHVETMFSEHPNQAPREGTATRTDQLSFDIMDGPSPSQLLSIAQLMPLGTESTVSDDTWLDSWLWQS